MNFAFHSYNFYLHFDVFWLWSQVYINRYWLLVKTSTGGRWMLIHGGAKRALWWSAAAAGRSHGYWVLGDFVRLFASALDCEANTEKLAVERPTLISSASFKTKTAHLLWKLCPPNAISGKMFGRLCTVRGSFFARFHDLSVINIELLETKATIQKTSSEVLSTIDELCYMQEMSPLMQKPSPPIAMQRSEQI